MRPIKFRAWDVKRQAYFEPSNDLLTANYDNLFLDVTTGQLGRTSLGLNLEPRIDDVSEDFVLEQYIGLKDSNGFEICEGDIVSYTDLDKSSFVAPVKYYGDEDYPAFDLDRSHVPDFYYFDSNVLSEGSALGKLFVVGNIHENAGLLEVPYGD